LSHRGSERKPIEPDSFVIPGHAPRSGAMNPESRPPGAINLQIPGSLAKRLAPGMTTCHGL
jgi:hypothetical protein